MKSRLLTASLALAAFGLAATAAQARTDVYLSIGVPGYVQPAPVYVQPAPVYVQPRPVYVQPQPYYVQPVSPYYGANHYGDRGYGHGHRHGWQGRRFGPHGDLDRDGVPNARDRDRDGDGIRNRWDRAPDNGYRY